MLRKSISRCAKHSNSIANAMHLHMFLHGIFSVQMLYAEQWGLDSHLLYALAKCVGDEPMLLCMSENPLLQYQLLRNPRVGIEGYFLQAGTPDGLMSYLFAQ